jgi:DNA-binding MurR/RpiR family transcriptional regulator
MTGKAIAAETGVSTATVSRVLKRLGLSRLSALEPVGKAQRTVAQSTGRMGVRPRLP